MKHAMFPKNRGLSSEKHGIWRCHVGCHVGYHVPPWKLKAAGWENPDFMVHGVYRGRPNTIFEPHILENEEIESEPEVSTVNESVLCSSLEPGLDEKEEETVTNSNACRENKSVPSSQRRIKMLNTLLTVITFLCLIYQVLCWMLTVSSVEKLHFILSPLSMFLESCGIKTQQSGKQT